MDKKFLVALLVILVLTLALAYVTFIGPRIQGYLIDRQVQAQQSLVEAIIQQANQQGFVQLSDGDQTIVLALVKPQQGVSNTQQNTQQIEQLAG